jgi:hypothetical protein
MMAQASFSLAVYGVRGIKTSFVYGSICDFPPEAVACTGVSQKKAFSCNKKNIWRFKAKIQKII